MKKFLLLLTSLFLTSCAATSSDTQTGEISQIDVWLYESDEQMASAYVTNTSDSLFSVICYYESGCIVGVYNGELCTDGADVPVLINTKSASMASTVARCVNPDDDESQTGALSFRLADLPTEFWVGEELSVLAPMDKASFKVSRFSLAGSEVMLNKAFKKWREMSKTEQGEFRDKVF